MGEMTSNSSVDKIVRDTDVDMEKNIFGFCESFLVELNKFGKIGVRSLTKYFLLFLFFQEDLNEPLPVSHH